MMNGDDRIPVSAWADYDRMMKDEPAFEHTSFYTEALEDLDQTYEELKDKAYDQMELERWYDGEKESLDRKDREGYSSIDFDEFEGELK